MAIHSVTRGTVNRPQKHSSQNASLVSPVSGIDSRIPIAMDDPRVCVYCYNIVPSEYGLRVRNGYAEHQVGLTQGNGLGVRTIIPFKGNPEDDSDDRLFAVTNEGIWDVTVSEGTPNLVFAFSDQTEEAGYGTYAHYLTGAGNDLLFYADSKNGLVQYEAATGTWSVPTGITGVDVGLINFVVVHKLRIWFCVQDSNLAYYLPLRSIAGEVEDFNFGSKFKHGGRLVGLYNWTVDGGNGVDDMLIAISSGGDVLPFQGQDPSTAETWSLVGTYFVGATAKGGRCASQYGGNVTILSTFGIIQMSDLLRGVDPRLPNQDSIGSKITPLIRAQMPDDRDKDGWDIKNIMSEGTMIINTPVRSNGEYIQFVYNDSVNGWGFWRGVPITCVDSWKSYVYFGTVDGRVMVMNANRDDVEIDPPNPEINGSLIEFSVLHNYQTLGSPAEHKRGKLIRPNFLSREIPKYNAKFFYDFETNENIFNDPVADSAVYRWDISQWDQAFWANSSNELYDRVIGGSGIGRYVSVAIKGQAITGTTLASTDITWDKGWYL